jgi:hypothetical protein
MSDTTITPAAITPAAIIPDVISPKEIARIMDDVAAWLKNCTCVDGKTVDDFFLDPGRVLSPEQAEACRRCPTRVQEVVLAYQLNIAHGYVAGLSPAKRRNMTLQQAVAFVIKDSSPTL